MFSEYKETGKSNLKIGFEPDIETGRDLIRVFWLDSKDEILRPVKKLDIERYPQQWAIYEQAKSKMVKIDGPFVSEIPMMDRGTAMSLRLKGINTVEQLANLDDFAAVSLDNERGMQWRDAAMMYMLANKKSDTPRRGRPPKDASQDEDTA